MAVTIDMMEYSTSALAQAAYVSSSTVPSPVSHYKMNDNAASKTVIDSAGSNNGTSDQNTDQVDVAGKINNALTFNGSSDFVNCGSPADFDFGTGNFSISAWVKTGELAAGIICGKHDAAATGFRFLISSGKLGTVIRGGATTGWVYADTAMNNDAWRHAVLVRDGSTARIYLDSDLDGTFANANGNITVTESLMIGAVYYSGTDNEHFDGEIDDVRIYDYALNQAEVSAIYNNDSGTEEENPTGGGLQSYSEDTIKTQGTYSLKGVAAITDSLNDTLTKVINPVSNADIDNEDMADISDWSDGDGGDAASTQVTFDSKSCMKLDAGSAGGANYAYRYQDIGSFGARTVISMNLYFDTIGTSANSDYFSFGAYDGSTRLAAKFASDGLYISDGSYQQIDASIVVQDVWQEWTFDINWTAQTVDVYLDNVLKYANVDCSDASATAEGTASFIQNGDTTADMLSYVDWFKAGSTYISGSPIDLSDQDVIKMSIRASRTGSNIKIGFHDAGGVTTEHTANVASADTFQTEDIDISAVANADKDAIDSIIVTITNADA